MRASPLETAGGWPALELARRTGLVPLLVALGLVPASVLLLASPRWPFAILPAVALLCAFVLGRRPELGYYTIVFFIPLALFRTLGESLTVSKLLGVATLALFLAYLLLRRKGSYDVSASLWKWLVLYFLVNLASTLLSDYRRTALDGMRQLVNVYVLFLLTLVFVERKGFTRTLPLVIMAGNFISSALSLYGHFSGGGRFSVNEGNRDEFIRSVGAETGPNDLAFVVLFSLPFFATAFFSSSSPRRRAFAVLGFAVGTGAIVLSYSRAGARILLLALLLIGLEHAARFRVRHLGLVIALGGAGASLALVLTPQSWWERQFSVSAATDSSVSRRASYLPVAFDAFLDHPVLGTGTYTFKEVWAQTSISRKFPPGADGTYRRVAHNSYAEVLTGAGASGFVLFLVIIGVAFRGFGAASRQLLRRGWREEAAVVRTYRTSFVLVLSFFFFLSLNFHKYFWLSLALSQVACRLAAADGADQSGDAAEGALAA